MYFLYCIKKLLHRQFVPALPRQKSKTPQEILWRFVVLEHKKVDRSHLESVN